METFRQLVSEFFKTFAFEIIFAIIFSTGLGMFGMLKIRNYIAAKNVGIVRIHDRGHNVKNLQKEMLNSQHIKIIAFMPLFFITDHQEILVKKLKEGCNVKLLICDPDGDLVKELCQIEMGTTASISSYYGPMIEKLQNIVNLAGANATGTIEIRKYNTEIRNPAFVFTNKKDELSAFVTVSYPPKRSIDTIMLEYKGEKCDTIKEYFDKIWELHKDDVLWKSKNT